MNTHHFRSHLAMLGVVVIASCASFAPLVDRQATAPELPGFGGVQMTVTTDVPAARHWFLHGVQQAHAFRGAEAQQVQVEWARALQEADAALRPSPRS